MLTLERMSKRKTPVPDDKPEDRAERKPVQIPVAWFIVLRKLAAMNKQPHLWYLLDLLNREAEAAKLEDVPPLPWQEDDVAKKGA